MYVERYGTGTREIYFGLHGWSGDHATFAPLAAHLPADATLYSADLPGCGRSHALPNLTVEALACEIADAVRDILRDATPHVLEIDTASSTSSPSHASVATPRASVTLVGNCSGAILGLLAAERIKQHVGRLVLIDPFAYWPWYFRVFVGNFGRYAYRSTFANPLGRWLTNQTLRKRRTAETDLTHSFGRIDHEVAQGYLALLAEVGSVERFAGLAGLPVEIAYGERTFAAVKKSVGMWQRVLPGARAHLLEGAGHLPILEATAQLARIVFRTDEDNLKASEEMTRAARENTAGVAETTRAAAVETAKAATEEARESEARV